MTARALDEPPAVVLDCDPFSRGFMDDPYPHYKRMREAGPFVWLPKYGIFSTSRYEQAHAVLTNWETFSSAAGVGLVDQRKQKSWRSKSVIQEVDPPMHTRTRAVLTRIMSPGVIRGLNDVFAREADIILDRLVARREFDGITDLADVYPLKVFPDVFGLGEDGRENLLHYGNMVFTAYGPRNEFVEEAFRNAEEVTKWIISKCERSALDPNGLGARVYAAVDAGELKEDEGPILVRSFLSGGVDTTARALGNALLWLARNPGEWDKLHANPSLSRSAFDETMRYDGSVQVFFRTLGRDTEIAGVPMREGEKVLICFGGANRDPQRFADPDRFDITRRSAGHLGFSGGIHGCVGQAVSRLEGELILGGLARRVKAIEITGEPVRRYNNTSRGLASLPLRVTPV